MTVTGTYSPVDGYGELKMLFAENLKEITI
jgi:hypothetical protein